MDPYLHFNAFWASFCMMCILDPYLHFNVHFRLYLTIFNEHLYVIADPDIIISFSCAPMTSVDFERAFSTFDDLLTSKKNHLTERHLKDQMFIQGN